jgi:hypothetical protein
MRALWSDAVPVWEGNEISFFILQDSLLWIGAGSLKDHAHNVSTGSKRDRSRSAVLISRLKNTVG